MSTKYTTGSDIDASANEALEKLGYKQELSRARTTIVTELTVQLTADVVARFASYPVQCVISYST